MDLSVKWLRELIDVPEDIKKLESDLTNCGLKIDEIHDFPGPREFLTVVKVVSAEKHPEADKLTVCRVSNGKTESTVVCGAPNVRAGIHAVHAEPGCRMSEDFIISARPLRGIESAGMLVSEKELGISDETAGIIVLPDTVAPGTPYGEYYDANRLALEVDVLANRGDALSVLGVARDCVALYKKEIRPPWRQSIGNADQGTVTIDIECPELCHRYVGKVVRNVKIAESPFWLKERIKSTGGRPINNVVDITNYILHLTGHPMHAFDLDQLAGQKIVVRCPKPDEKIVTLDDVERQLPADACLICDEHKAVAVGGVMGGANSEVSNDTSNLLLEVAEFNPRSVRSTARFLGLKTDSSYRFERGINKDDALQVIELAAALIEEIAGGEAAAGVIDIHPVKDRYPKVPFSPAAITGFIGEEIGRQHMLDILEDLGFIIEGEGEELTATPPGWRHDIEHQVDLVEEIIRIHGYNNVSSTLPGKLERNVVKSEYHIVQEMSRFLASIGFTETLNFDFLSEEEVTRFHHGAGIPLTLLNPLGQEFSTMRTTLIPSMIRNIRFNLNKGASEFRFFEISNTVRGYPFEGVGLRTDVILKKADGTYLVKDDARICMAMSAPAAGIGWNLSNATADFYQFKFYVEQLFAAFGKKLSMTQCEEAPFPWHPGVCGNIVVAGVNVGIMGQIHPEFAKEADVPETTLMAEFNLEKLFEEQTIKRFTPVSRYPVARFDLALVLEEKMPQVKVLEIIEREGGEFLHQIQLFDVYSGERLTKGFKSLAYELQFQSVERTLRDDEVKDAVNRILSSLKEEVGARLRDA